MKIFNKSGNIIFEDNNELLYQTIANAIRMKIDLSGADLRGADLSWAYLSGADLSGADLSGADLSRANLRWADLSGADLSGADLSMAYLSGADLSRADLRGADLSMANLSETDLSGVYLSGADLSGADLSRAEGINYHSVTPLSFLKDQPGKIRAYKLVNAENNGPYYSLIKYKIGELYEVNTACEDIHQQCAEGISLATLDWCIKEWKKGYEILIAEFEAKDIAAIPIATDGKFRVFRCTIVDKKNLKDIGLIDDPETTE